MSIEASELIINPDGSIYHLGLKPEELATTVITVGDPDRVSRISDHFDRVEVKKHKREFNSHTGIFRGKRITVMSTGMGTDNIDIALTELDALVNIDFEKRQVKDSLTRLDIIRIGTTGSIQENIPVDSFVVSEMALGFDGLMHYYDSEAFLDQEMADAFVKQTNWSSKKALPYVVHADKDLFSIMHSSSTHAGFTGTNIGFYGPQGRILRSRVPDPEMNQKISSFNYKNRALTNLEMETSGIYGMSKLLGHRAISMNVVLANRITGEFSSKGDKKVDELIVYTLDKLA